MPAFEAQCHLVHMPSLKAIPQYSMDASILGLYCCQLNTQAVLNLLPKFCIAAISALKDSWSMHCTAHGGLGGTSNAATNAFHTKCSTRRPV